MIHQKNLKPGAIFWNDEDIWIEISSIQYILPVIQGYMSYEWDKHILESSFKLSAKKLIQLLNRKKFKICT